MHGSHAWSLYSHTSSSLWWETDISRTGRCFEPTFSATMCSALLKPFSLCPHTFHWPIVSQRYGSINFDIILPMWKATHTFTCVYFLLVAELRVILHWVSKTHVLNASLVRFGSLLIIPHYTFLKSDFAILFKQTSCMAVCVCSAILWYANHFTSC